MRNAQGIRGEMPAASQLLARKSKPKVKIRMSRKEGATFRRHQLITVINMLAIELILSVCLLAPIIECRSHSSLRSARHTATDKSAINATAINNKLSSPSQQLRLTTTTSELSFEFLNLKSMPSNQLCQIEGHERVNSVSFANNQIKSLPSRAFTCISFRLKILNLRNNRIELISDDAFAGLDQLQVLILEGNKLAQVPTRQVGGSHLASLRHLNLAGNQIGSVEVASFEPGAQLISLDLRANPLKAIHSQSFAKLSSLKTLTLTHLDFQASHLDHFGGALSELRFLHLDQFGANLSSLEAPFCESSRNLAGLSLKANRLKRVPQFTNCLNLISLDLSYNSIQGSLDGANFSLQPNLIDLYLGHNQLEYLGEGALVGLERLQVLELAANKLKSIHPGAFLPVRASLYELNIANNVHLAELPPNGLEGLISLRASGNNQLRKLPAHLPAARSLALTYAYHCCDYYRKPTVHGEDDPLLVAISGSYTGARSTSGHNEPQLATSARLNQNYNENNGDESLISQLIYSISSKLSRFWFWRPSPGQPHEDNSDLLDSAVATRASTRASRREHDDDDDANLRNLSEFVLWPNGADRQDYSSSAPPFANNQEMKSTKWRLQQGRRRRRRATTDASSKLTSAPVDERQVVTRPEVARARRDGVRALQPSGVMIDELIWQMRRIRFAHSLGGRDTDDHDDDDDEWPPHDRVADAEWPPLEPLDSWDSQAEAHLVAVGLRAASRQLAGMSAGPRRTRRADYKRVQVDSAREDANDNQRVQCAPEPDAFQPCRDLFDSMWLRASVWLVFLLAFLGNICVIVVLGSVRPSSSTSALTSIMWFNAAHSKRHIDVPRFLVLNLALADLLMACYLGILALVDLSTLGEFRLHAIKWQYSPGCKLAGFLAVLSSELSVFILAIITLERNYAITNAVHLNRRLSLQKAMVIMFFGYVYALAMALMPLNGINDYRKLSICLPLKYEPNEPLLHSSSNLYLVMLITINALSFVLLLSCYLRMYCAIRGSQAWNTNDLKIAKRMSVLVVTDFLCWSPIICVAIAGLFGRHLVGPDGLKLLVIFVLPLNSVANPFLYAITTKKFKRDLAILKKRLRLEQAARHLHTASAYLACSWARKAHSGAGATGSIPVATTMDQTYYRKSKHKLEVRKLMVGSVQVAGKRGKTNLSSRQELLAAAAAAATSNNQNRMAATGSSRAGSRLVRLNRHHFQSFERNEDFAADQIVSTHCPSCRRKLALAARVTASAQEPPSCLNSTTRPQALEFEPSQQELSYLLERTSCTRPRIVLDAVEPVVGVAMAPLRLVEDVGDGGRQLSAIMPDLSRANSQTRAPSSAELLVGDQNHANPDGHQKRASSADQASGRAQKPANLARLSCQTVLVSDKLTRSVLLAHRVSNDAFTSDNNNNRSVSACAFMWPQSAKLGHSKPTGADKASCQSCSCVRVVASSSRLALSQQSSARGQVLHELVRAGGTGVAADRNGPSGPVAHSRTKSFNRLLLQPLAKAWSNLQLSLQSGLSGSASGIANTQQKSSASSHIRMDSTQSNRRQASPVPSELVACAPDARCHSPPNTSATGSSEQDQLLFDEHEEDVIIEDILEMSSPARRRLLKGGRRMSRSCDVIIEQSYAGHSTTTSGIHRGSMTSGTTAEPATSSSYCDQNDDQRILLATINQLSARRQGGARRQGTRTDQSHQAPRAPARRYNNNNNSRQVAQGASDRRRASFTRCRSWSPALLDKLEDCMYQIKSRIPNFIGGEPRREEASISSFGAVGAHQPSTRLDGARATNARVQYGETTSDESGSTSSSSSSGAIVEDEDEEDEFNEVGLDEWTRNMQKKAPVNCYTKSASRHRLKQQLSGNSDTLSGRTIGTTLTSVSFDSSSNIPAIISSHAGQPTDLVERRESDGDDARGHNANDE